MSDDNQLHSVFKVDWMLPMFKKPQNLKGLTVNLVQGLFKQCSRVQIFLLFCKTKLYGQLLHIME